MWRPATWTTRRPTSARKRAAGYHLVLLAKNRTGYKNLIKLVSKGYLEGFYYKPRVSKYLLNKYSEGLIALSACLAGEVPRKLLNEGMDAGVEMAPNLRIHLSRQLLPRTPGQRHRQAGHVSTNCSSNAPRRTGLPLVATNDCHYLTAEDYEAHDTLLCIQTQTTVDAEKRFRMGNAGTLFQDPGGDGKGVRPRTPRPYSTPSALPSSATSKSSWETIISLNTSSPRASRTWTRSSPSSAAKA